jgi:hypothetical protein
MNLPCPAELRAVRVGDSKLAVSGDGRPVDLGTFGLSGGTGRARRMMYDRNASGFTVNLPTDLGAGRYEISAEIVIAPGTNPPSRGFSIVIINGQVQRRGDSRTDLVGQSLTLRQPITIIGSDAESPIRAIDVPDGERSVLINQLRPTLLRRGSSFGGGFVDDGTFMLEFPTAGLPLPVAFDVIIRTSSREGVLGTFVSGQRIQGQSDAAMDGLISITMNGRTISGANPSASVVSGRLGFKPGERVTVILKPRGSLVESTVDQGSFANTELIFDDVPVEAPPPDPFEEMNRRMEEMLKGRFPR